MATYDGITPRHQDDFRQATQRTDNSQTRNENYNGFMTHRENEPQSNPKSLSLEYGKTIRLLRNGDEFYKGQKVVINSRKYRYFDVFLDDLSDKMQARFGAVRNIHTPVHGHRVKSLDQIEDGKTYVASGAGRFVRLNYLEISEGKRTRLPNRLPALHRNVDYSNIQVPQYDKPANILIYVYRNGDVLTPPAKVLLTKNTLSSYDAVLNEITFKVQLLNGAVLKLYTLDGETVVSPNQLHMGHGYVAANKEKFKRCEYSTQQDLSNGSPRNVRKINSQPIHNSSNLSTSGKSTFSYPGKPYTGWHKEQKREGSLPPVIGPKPNRQNQNSQKSNNSRLDLDRDEGGIFKAKNKNPNNAKTIQDSKDMYVDMPVDYRKPREIIDEEIDDRRNRAPLPQNTIAKANSKQPQKQQQNLRQSPVQPKQSAFEPPPTDDNLTMNSVNMSDIPTIDSSTSSNDQEYKSYQEQLNYKIEYNQNYQAFEDELNEMINNRTFTYEQNEEANLTRALNMNDNLEETYEIAGDLGENQEDNDDEAHTPIQDDSYYAQPENENDPDTPVHQAEVNEEDPDTPVHQAEENGNDSDTPVHQAEENGNDPDTPVHQAEENGNDSETPVPQAEENGAELVEDVTQDSPVSERENSSVNQEAQIQGDEIVDDNEEVLKNEINLNNEEQQINQNEESEEEVTEDEQENTTNELRVPSANEQILSETANVLDKLVEKVDNQASEESEQIPK
ncbi:unnamed protein product [Brachionus calyciflorus]|uniref:Doublecortin domain-containing protein n=1 Tax=Brachionus calyciflorus TaxID=104777 RepID=A0A813WJH6_9BILA|nr:unnamed protein product [Brachionus calyciflorus]